VKPRRNAPRTGAPTLPGWSPAELRILEGLSDPFRIQSFLDTIPYSADPIYRCPRSVLRDRKAHCFDGAVFAASALRRLGAKPLLVDLRAERDDDHVLALFRRNGRIGAIAKSNFVTLRFREPLFRNVRELALSYFEFYYNVKAEKTLRAFSDAVDLRSFDRLGWEHSDAAMDVIAKKLDAARHYRLLTRADVRKLAPVDRRTYDAGLQGSVSGGLYKP
jgi:hypothetical protein